MEKHWFKNREMMNLRSSVNSPLAADRNVGARMSRRTFSLIVGLVALVLAVVTLFAAVSIVGAGAAERILPDEAFIRSVALTGQNLAGTVAAGGPAIGQSVFPGEALARSLAPSSQAISEALVRARP
jgi:hypothetical protein